MSEQSSSTLTPKDVVEGLTELRDKICKSKYETPTSLVLDEASESISDYTPTNRLTEYMLNYWATQDLS